MAQRTIVEFRKVLYRATFDDDGTVKITDFAPGSRRPVLTLSEAALSALIARARELVCEHEFSVTYVMGELLVADCKKCSGKGFVMGRAK